MTLRAAIARLSVALYWKDRARYAETLGAFRYCAVRCREELRAIRIKEVVR